MGFEVWMLSEPNLVCPSPLLCVSPGLLLTSWVLITPSQPNRYFMCNPPVCGEQDCFRSNQFDLFLCVWYRCSLFVCMLMYLLMLTNTVQSYRYFSVSAHKNKFDSFMANNCDIHIVKCRLILCLMINLLFFCKFINKGKRGPFTHKFFLHF